MSGEEAYQRLLSSNFDFPWVTRPEHSLAALCAGAELVFFSKGDLVYDTAYDGDALYVVREGRVFNYFVTSKGHEKVVGVFTEGSLLGELYALDRRTDFYLSQVSSEKASLYKIPCARFRRAFDCDPEIRMAVYESLTEKVRLLSRQIEYSVCTAAVSKIAYLLLSACKTYGTPCGEGHRIGLNFTHNEIARICGISRVSVSNNLQQLRARGAVAVEDGHWVLLDLEYLMSLVQ